MTQPPHRPGPPDWRGRGAPPPHPGQRRPPPRPPEPPTQPAPAHHDQPTEQLRARKGPASAGPTQRIPRPPSPADVRPTQQIERPAPPPPPSFGSAPDGGEKPRRRRGVNKMTIALLAVILVALLAGGLAAGELYARQRADSILTEVAECVTEDGVKISFGVNPPFLWQHMTGHYTNISVTTDGKRVQSADGMTAQVTLADVRLQDTGDSKGTIGSLDATLSWKSAGIKDTVAANLPGVGNLVTGVRTDSAAGTVILEAGDNSVTAKPVVTDGDLNLQVLDVTGPLPKDAVQTALNDLTKKLNDNYPLGIHADSVEVTDSGVVGKFSSRDAAIPKEDANPCFARL
ncbi:hypothetical protein A5752_14195 [Mycobacterium sp. 852002-51961_SCH5331710]|nr:DUF2993 domain-containing protein [Mycobacterium sp. 852002-51961_SCH5331710]OBB37202.1 hypothetical protein A5752_14195 [Mycobacterium sp. 852002-51961_SCH5331710]